MIDDLTSTLTHNLFLAYVRHFPLTKGKQRLIDALWSRLSTGRYLRQTHLKDYDIWMQCDIRQYIHARYTFTAHTSRKHDDVHRTPPLSLAGIDGE
jgi:hypothetical protein